MRTLSNKKRKTTISLSLEKDIVDKIRVETKITNSSLNGRINFILRKHVDFYQPAQQIGSVISPAKIWRGVVEKTSEKDLEELIINDSLMAIQALLNHKSKPLTMNNAIKYAFQEAALWSGICNYFSYTLDDDGYLTLIFTHLFGIKWSRILCLLFNRFVREVLDLPTSDTVTENTVVIRVLAKGLLTE